MDIFRKIRPESSESQLVLAGKIFTLIIVVISILWIPVIRHMSDQIYQYLQAVQSYISPPIAAVFIVGVLWKKASGKAAFTTLITGGVIGALRFILDLVSKSHHFRLDILNQIVNISFLNFCIILFIICVGVIIGVSLISPEKLTSKQSILTLKIDEGEKHPSKIWKNINIAMSILIGLTIISLWAHFT